MPSKADMLVAYARYTYGDEGKFFHSPTQLDEFAIVARQYGCVTIAAFFDLLAERCQMADMLAEQQAEQEHERERQALLTERL